MTCPTTNTTSHVFWSHDRDNVTTFFSLILFFFLKKRKATTTPTRNRTHSQYSKHHYGNTINTSSSQTHQKKPETASMFSETAATNNGNSPLWFGKDFLLRNQCTGKLLLLKKLIQISSDLWNLSKDNMSLGHLIDSNLSQKSCKSQGRKPSQKVTTINIYCHTNSCRSKWNSSLSFDPTFTYLTLITP